MFRKINIFENIYILSTIRYHSPTDYRINKQNDDPKKRLYNF